MACWFLSCSWFWLHYAIGFNLWYKTSIDWERWTYLLRVRDFGGWRVGCCNKWHLWKWIKTQLALRLGKGTFFHRCLLFNPHFTQLITKKRSYAIHGVLPDSEASFLECIILWNTGSRLWKDLQKQENANDHKKIATCFPQIMSLLFKNLKPLSINWRSKQQDHV